MTKAEEFVPEVFLKLTSKTYPHGHEHVIAEEMLKLGLFPEETVRDVHGNYFLKIGESKTIFASHLDTVSKTFTKVTHKFDGDFIRTDGKTTLGADDKAGVTIMTWMIQNKIPGLYYFFIGEEVGCIGSGLTAKYYNFDFKENEYERIISFDRRGTDSVITHQSWSRCCSDVFANALCKEFNKSGLSYKTDDGGVYTDSAEFVDLISECTNVSVGYYKEHSTSEHQDIKHLVKLADACLKVDWESLPTKRDKKSYEAKEYTFTKTKTKFDTKSYEAKVYQGFDEVDFDNIDSPANKRGWSRNGTINKTKNTRYKDYMDSSYNDDDDDFYFKTPGLKEPNWEPELEKLKSNIYYDNGGELKPLDPFEIDPKQYNWILSKFNDTTLSKYELSVIREQYLDIENSDYDKNFYEDLVDGRFYS
jgi:hypothetical protein